MIFSRLSRRSASWVIAAGLIVVGGPIAWRSSAFQRPSLRQDELGFRESALYSVAPTYPSLVSPTVEGVAVAQVQLEPSGVVAAVEILESPHNDASRSMTHALLQWRFPVVRLPGHFLAARVRGKITYYFAVAQGVGVVRTPEEQTELRQMADGSSLSDTAKGSRR